MFWGCFCLGLLMLVYLCVCRFWLFVVSGCLSFVCVSAVSVSSSVTCFCLHVCLFIYVYAVSLFFSSKPPTPDPAPPPPPFFPFFFPLLLLPPPPPPPPPLKGLMFCFGYSPFSSCFVVGAVIMFGSSFPPPPPLSLSLSVSKSRIK